MKANKKPKNHAEPLANMTVPGGQASTNNIYLALSFVLPFTILGTVFALRRVFPFGDQQILIRDFYNQYYPFISNFWHKLREGTVSTWSWTAGGGHDYLALATYYLASPLNLLALLLPYSWIREALTLGLLAKIGCAGLSAGIFLRYAFKQSTSKECSPALPVFSSLYALCAFTLGYYANIIWFDGLALMPLVMTGLLALINEGKYRLYVISLAVTVLTNYYMGFYICVFVAIMFFGQCIIQKLNAKDFLRKLGQLAAFSCLAIGMAAAFLLPAWSALRNIYSANTPFPNKPELYYNFFDVLGNFIAFTPPTVLHGLPNLYCGMISVMLAGVFLSSPKISAREKLVFAGTAVFLLIGCVFNMLEFILDGFRYSRGFPARFSFLISFTVMVMAYRGFLLAEGLGKRGIVALGAGAIPFLLSAVIGPQEKTYIIASAVLCVVYIVILYFMSTGTAKARQFLRWAFFLVIIAELSVSAYIGVKTATTVPRDNYPGHYDNIQELLRLRQTPDNGFYRTEINGLQTYNDTSFYNYNGLAFYSSTANYAVFDFVSGLGLPCAVGGNYYFYTETSPLTNALLSIHYIISVYGNATDANVYWEIAGKAGDSLLLKNKYCLPLGFMVDKKLADYKQHYNPFQSQNNFFNRATGLAGDLFTITELTSAPPAYKATSLKDADSKDGQNRNIWNYQMPADGMLYFYCEIEDNEQEQANIYKNGEPYCNTIVFSDRPYLLCIGWLSKDDIVSFSVETKKPFICTGYLNSELFEQGYNLLASQPLNITEFTQTKVCGTVTALNDGLLYTSIPVDKNWSAYVDGVKSKIVLIEGAMAAVRLKKGFHEIEFKYFNKSFLIGGIISLFSLGIFVTLIALNKRRRIFTTNLTNLYFDILS